ncbi:MAG TPA: hypothetical protein VFM55_09885 [Micromonosporaceae bacterium]|nr:hypothetical protein [Micromonosporaceae bacterium]
MAMLGAAPAVAGPGAQAEPARKSEPLPAPPQVQALDFLLGSYKCVDTPSPGAQPAVVYVTTKRVLEGHYYESEVSIRPDVLLGRATMGWNPVEGKIVSFYVDNWGTTGTSVSPGLVDGHLVLTGSILQVISPSPTGSAPGVRLGIQDDYQPLGPGHFTNLQTITLPDGNTIQHSYDCNRR